MDTHLTQPISADTVNEKSPWKTAETFLGENPFLSSFLVSSFITALILLLFKPYFEWSDDYYADLILKGIDLNWAPSELNILENPLLCLVLKNLFIQFPAVEWFSGFFIFSHFLSTWALLAAFHLGTNRVFKTLLFILGFSVLSVRFFVSMQYTAVAATAAIGAFMLLAALWQRDDTRFFRPGLGLSFALIMISVLVRPYSLGLVILAFAPAAIYLAWKVKMTPSRRTLLKFLIITALFASAAVAFRHYDYARHPEWKDYDAITDQYVQLSQFRKPDYTETTKPVFDSIGWSENDRNLFSYNYFLDPDIYSVEKLRVLNRYFPHFALDKDPQDSFESMFANPGFLAAFFFFLAILPFITAENFWFIAVDVLWTVSILCFCRWYLKMPERIFSPCLYLLNSLVLFFSAPKFKDPAANSNKTSLVFKWGTAFLILYSFFSFYFLYFHYARDRYWTAQETALKSSVEYLNPQDDQVFVTWGDGFPYTKIGAFDNDEFLRHFHTISIDWFQRSPITTAMMDHYGLKNLFKDMVDNPKVFLICHPDELNLYQVYMREKYKMNVIFRRDFNSDQFMVFSVHSS